MFDEIAPLLRRAWDQLLPGQPPPGEMECVLLSRSRVTLFVFDAHTRFARPLAIVKVSRTPKQNNWHAGSVAKVATVRSAVDDRMRSTIPNVVLLGQVRGLICTAETVLLGKQMTVPGRNVATRGVQRQICAVSTWLQTLHRQTTAGRQCLDCPALDQLFSAPLSAVADTDGRDSSARAQLRELASRLLGSSLPLGWRYGDPNPGNFLLDGASVRGAVDWVGCRPDSWPIFDWCDFVFDYAVASHRAMAHRRCVGLDDGLAAIDILLAPQRSHLGRTLRAATVLFLEGQGLDTALWPAIFAAFLPTLRHSWDVASLARHALPLLLDWRRDPDLDS